MFRRTLIGLVLAGLSVCGFASTFIFGAKLTKDCGLSAEVLSFLRFAIAGSVLFSLGATTREGRKTLFAVNVRLLVPLTLLGIIGTSLMAWCVFMGCARVSAANASMADALTPLMIFAVGAFKTRRVELREMVGLVFGLIGALLVIEVISMKGFNLTAYSVGDVFILLAAATWGVYTVYGAPYVLRMGATAFSAWTMLLGAASLLPFLPFLSSTWPSDTQTWLLTILLGLVSTLMPFWTWNAAQKFLPTSLLALTAYSTPVVAVALASLFLGERATLLQWLGTVFVIGSVLSDSHIIKRK